MISASLAIASLALAAASDEEAQAPTTTWTYHVVMHGPFVKGKSDVMRVATVEIPHLLHGLGNEDTETWEKELFERAISQVADYPTGRIEFGHGQEFFDPHERWSGVYILAVLRGGFVHSIAGHRAYLAPSVEVLPQSVHLSDALDVPTTWSVVFSETSHFTSVHELHEVSSEIQHAKKALLERLDEDLSGHSQDFDVWFQAMFGDVDEVVQKGTDSMVFFLDLSEREAT